MIILEKIIYFLSLLIALSSANATAQFNTILPKEKEKERSVMEDNKHSDRDAMPLIFNTVLPKGKKTIIEETAAANESQSDNTKTIQPLRNLTSQKEEPAKIVLEGMRKRQYLSLPVDELKVNSKYGFRNDPFTGKRKFHKGIDLAADFNYVYSVMPGRVLKSGKNREFGEFVQVQHGDFITIYGHLFQRLVTAKEAVEAGQPIGISGSTGRSTDEHLHFGMSFEGKSIDPLPILNYILSIMQESKAELERIIKEDLVPQK